MKYFETKFLIEAEKFISTLDQKVIRKILFNIDVAEQTNDPRLFKKLQNDIWELRTNYGGLQVRLLAFWDKSDRKNTLVIATSGFIKQTEKVPTREIEKAINIRMQYIISRKETK